ncbi:MAG: tRNA uridine-5-carboxymethylaminomethyl(34) synthesis GTPase MnmE [Clostridiales Family XIII bacterium]|jgi:tRNA modification GTPase|nr:tRNA uridine-5-carboxymethylaminomethyl(34) synthesis GTPase MnmE [Clostridiales Family XIII bacterium]
MNDTVAAISTPVGEGGIGVVRISGTDSRAVLERLFRPKAGKTAGKKAVSAGFQNRYMRYGHITDPVSGNAVDEVLAVFMEAPRTYTGEDVAEIHCHGSAVALRRVLSLALREGVRLAEPGEFTKRAFLNGRLDLTQAEAVIDLIQAKTDMTFDTAIRQLDGSLSIEVKKLRDGITELLVDITVNLDYPEEDIDELTQQDIIQNLSALCDQIEKLSASAHTGRIAREGLRVVITGKPNVGKSSLLNALLHESRAIVTEIPGTTRDTIEEGLSIRGIPIRLVDTAGIRETEDPVEMLGVEGSREALAGSDLALLVLDASESLSDADLRVLRCVANRRFIAVINKCDLARRTDADDVRAWIVSNGAEQTNEDRSVAVEMSVKDGVGLDTLEDAIEDFVFRGNPKTGDSALVTSVRHSDLLEKALSEIREGIDMSARGETTDLIEPNIRRAWEFLGEITGETATADIINEVFARFCVGK